MKAIVNDNKIQYGESADEFKPIGEISLPDPRQENFAHLASNGICKVTLEGYYSTLEKLTLNISVPADVRVSYDTAKNLLLYSWFVYRFRTLAEFQAYATLEYALRMKIGLKETQKGWGLGRCFEHALKNGWFKDNGIRQYNRLVDSWKEQWGSEPIGNLPADQWVRRLKDSFPPLRNTIAHGRPYLGGGSLLVLEICADLINQLYP